MGGKGVGNFNDLYKRMKGRYLIVLEGDDFWTYAYKLQKEYDFLEAHPDYIALMIQKWSMKTGIRGIGLILAVENQSIQYGIFARGY